MAQENSDTLRLNFRRPSAPVFQLDVLSSDSVQRLRERVASHLEIDEPDRVRVVYRGHVLSGEETLSGIGIPNDGVIHIALRPPGSFAARADSGATSAESSGSQQQQQQRPQQQQQRGGIPGSLPFQMFEIPLGGGNGGGAGAGGQQDLGQMLQRTFQQLQPAMHELAQRIAQQQQPSQGASGASAAPAPASGAPPSTATPASGSATAAGSTAPTTAAAASGPTPSTSSPTTAASMTTTTTTTTGPGGAAEGPGSAAGGSHSESVARLRSAQQRARQYRQRWGPPRMLFLRQYGDSAAPPLCFADTLRSTHDTLATILPHLRSLEDAMAHEQVVPNPSDRQRLSEGMRRMAPRFEAAADMLHSIAVMLNCVQMGPQPGTVRFDGPPQETIPGAERPAFTPTATATRTEEQEQSNRTESEWTDERLREVMRRVEGDSTGRE